jgi:hypothetical protein
MRQAFTQQFDAAAGTFRFLAGDAAEMGRQIAAFRADTGCVRPQVLPLCFVVITGLSPPMPQGIDTFLAARCY